MSTKNKNEPQPTPAPAPAPETPTTALDGLMPNGNTLGAAPGADEPQPTPGEVQGTEEQTTLPVFFDPTGFAEYAKSLEDAQFEQLLELVHGEAFSRGLITDKASEATDSTAGAGNPNDSAAVRDTGPSANAAGPVQGASSDDIPEGHVRVTHKTTKLQQDMPKATWDVLGAAGQKEFTKHTNKPKDLD